MVTTRADAEFMRRALFLAERGRGTTTPNPIVGAVIVSADGVVVGQGAHRVAGGPHAEVVALEAAGSHARGATLYCTLEPCSHTGRTGPCAERVAGAGIARVVIAVGDPNPRVNGRGVEYLRQHGLLVDEGVGREEALRQHAPFFTWVRDRRPHVTLKVALSRDGFVGKRDARVRLTSAPMDRRMHQQRAAVDAIAVGSSTVLVDDPELTARLAFRARPLVRVIFDRRGRIAEPGREDDPRVSRARPRVFSTEAAGPVLIARGTVVETLAMLADRNVQALLVEGGPTLHQAFWDAGLVDRVQLIETPTMLGGGVPGFVPPRDAIAEKRTEKIGPDWLTEWDVHRTH